MSFDEAGNSREALIGPDVFFFLIDLACAGSTLHGVGSSDLNSSVALRGLSCSREKASDLGLVVQ